MFFCLTSAHPRKEDTHTFSGVATKYFEKSILGRKSLCWLTVCSGEEEIVASRKVSQQEQKSGWSHWIWFQKSGRDRNMTKFLVTFHSPGSWSGNSPSYSAKDFLPQYNHNSSTQGCPEACLPVITRFSQVDNCLTTTKCNKNLNEHNIHQMEIQKVNIHKILLITSEYFCFLDIFLTLDHIN